EKWGVRAVVHAGPGVADHLRAAIMTLSANVPTRTVYGHLGWEKDNGQDIYLHAGGGIGRSGPGPGVEVQLTGRLADFLLPVPPTGEDLKAAIRASLRIGEVAPDRITVPLLGATYRAVLGQVDYALHLCGPTGTGKTELAALQQQHWGCGLDARNLPASWISTPNALESTTFTGKDTIVVVDDFAPHGSSYEIARLYGAADRLFRALGNHAG